MFDGPDPRSLEPRDREGADPREPAADVADTLTRGLDLPRGTDRERVHVHEHDQEYRLRGSEVRALATIGAFRVVAADDLRDDEGRPGDVRHADLERLRAAGLIRSVAPIYRDKLTTVVALTERGREVLERSRVQDEKNPQTFHAGAVKSRQLSHDAQVYRAVLRAAERIRQEGGHLRRVVLDDELKRDYQRFLQAPNRGRSDSDGRPARTAAEIKAWADEHDLPSVNGHVQFPDVRVEYEHADGRREALNVEVTTLHYRGAHAAGKAAAGFTRFRGSTARAGGDQTSRGGGPFDPDVAGEFL